MEYLYWALGEGAYFSACGDTSKAVKEALIGIIAKKTEWHEDIICRLKDKKAVKRELAADVIAKQGICEYEQELKQALEQEKTKN